jgi:hypothetical protein
VRADHGRGIFRVEHWSNPSLHGLRARSPKPEKPNLPYWRKFPLGQKQMVAGWA